MTESVRAEREAEVRAAYARIQDGHGACQEDVGALLEILDTERMAATKLLAFAERVAEYFHYREDDRRPLREILADIEADARATIAKPEGKP